MDDKKMNKVPEKPDENVKNKEVQNNRQPIDDTDLEKVSGGGIFSHSKRELINLRPEDNSVF